MDVGGSDSGDRLIRLPARTLLCWAHMADVTPLLQAINQGDPGATNQLMPLVYDELRRLAAAQVIHENPGQSLNATALVHEAYLRLVGDGQFADRGHFFR